VKSNGAREYLARAGFIYKVKPYETCNNGDMEIYWNNPDGAKDYAFYYPHSGYVEIYQRESEKISLHFPPVTPLTTTTPRKEEPKMNYSTAIFLISDDVRAIECSYDKGADGTGFSLEYFKTFDQNIKVGDYVVVPTNTRHEKTVVRVEAVDIEIDVDHTDYVHWVVDIVNTEQFKTFAGQERKAIDAMKAAERLDAKKKMKEKMVGLQEAQAVLEDKTTEK